MLKPEAQHLARADDDARRSTVCLSGIVDQEVLCAFDPTAGRQSHIPPLTPLRTLCCLLYLNESHDLFFSA